ncbi:MAG: ribosomal RNA small subunit methyltransferase A [Candidatus Moranbacteria bacterium CG_4_10_14_3_um_filter_44_15]|nr:MAG: ribosomal RNA small subunit methyltransferase A [Candidatus Moranbacteria bacterium CG06_land_8_20_14_3_00_43_56]PIV84389.1 MAG: ribosomal RNA small subunit methyltransferase A [Candidatus Moranbacteria bacterium CG17_big_fil_post_rev_8_21_14_2_50_44_12]PIW93417.1 MAG: ribosomal RNA small subunit methyltransferase A [Candidatus Moranbacteria bacterium CG_4_8_14_3_um_filter_43_15]PIX90611.1 MAG: ribosomal RNA small subunit methyltransferase A [Candidatus Moranbacteria bacterium CG_4_10_14
MTINNMFTKLGQNFLTDDSVAKQIVDSANLSPRDNVLEIGPGKGILTKYLARHAGRVLAVEVDRDLAESLQPVIARSAATKQSRTETGNTGLLRPPAMLRKAMRAGFARNDKLTVVKGDILKINLPKLVERENFKNYKVVANLPYYITSKIIRLLLETKYPPAEMILTVQKEVGERICAKNGQESILSISVKFYAEPKILFYVPKENFEPVPEVDSVVIKIKRKKSIPNVDVKKFFSLVRSGFSSKRKMLANNLSSSFRIPKAELWEWMKKARLGRGVRAEKLGVEDWVRLYRFIL